MNKLVRASVVTGMIAGCLSMSVHAEDTSKCDKVSAIDRVIALQAIANLMGRYSHLGQLRGEPTLGELFALKTEGVSWRTPTGPQGIEGMKTRLLKDGETYELPKGQLHTHSMLTPVIEIAGDGKTAKGVWDSYQPGANNGEDAGNIAWAKYGVDFIKEEGKWKIWHMQTYSIFNTPWNKTITESARERREAATAAAANPSAAGMGAGGAAPAAGAGMGAADAGTNVRTAYTGPKNPWRYDGVSTPRGPKIPEPYCTFDPKDSFGNVE